MTSETRDFRDIAVTDLPAASKSRFWLPLSRDADGGEIAIPVWVARGQRDGPVLCVIAGTHGNEHEGQTALHLWWDTLEPERLAGTMVAIPHLNIVAAMAYDRVSPVDRLDLNRICPGREDGYLTERIADLFFRHVAPQIDSLVDIHSGGPMTDTMPCTLYRDPAGHPRAEEVLALAKATLVPALWVAPTRLGGAGCTLSEECMNRGIPAVTFEMGGRGAVLADCLAHIRKALDNVLATLGLTDVAAETLPSYAIVSGWFTHAEVGGLFLPRHATGDSIKAGEPLGEIRDFNGETRQSFVAEHDGVLLSQRVSTIHPGDWVLALGKLL